MASLKFPKKVLWKWPGPKNFFYSTQVYKYRRRATSPGVVCSVSVSCTVYGVCVAGAGCAHEGGCQAADQHAGSSLPRPQHDALRQDRVSPSSDDPRVR